MSKQKFSVLIAEPMAAEGLALLTAAPALTVHNVPNITRMELMEEIAKFDALLVRSQTQVDRELLARGKNLKLIGRAGVGLDNIDAACARENKITVVNTPTGNSIATAEFTMGLLLSLVRHIPKAAQDLGTGGWNRGRFMGFELAQKTLGIFGFGHVGRLVAQRAKAFAMNVIACDPFLDDSAFTEYGVEKVSFDDLLSRSQVISLHCQLTSDTSHIMNETNLAKMRPGALLINAARGELIDDNALMHALDQGHLAMAAVDVFKSEPPAKNHPLINHPKVLATPHLGASSKEAQVRVSTQLAEQVIGFVSKLNALNS
jgi:D-3-phosphoglycerate dehydrogenase